MALRQHHAEILKEAAGKKEQEDSGVAPFAVPRAQVRWPQVRRIFRPDASPAEPDAGLPVVVEGPSGAGGDRRDEPEAAGAFALRADRRELKVESPARAGLIHRIDLSGLLSLDGKLIEGRLLSCRATRLP